MPLRAPCAQVAKPVSSRDVPPRRIEPQPSPEPMVATPVWAVLPLGPNGASRAVAVTTDAMRRSADTVAFGAASADEELCQTPWERGTVQAAGALVGLFGVKTLSNFIAPKLPADFQKYVPAALGVGVAMGAPMLPMDQRQERLYVYLTLLCRFQNLEQLPLHP